MISWILSNQQAQNIKLLACQCLPICVRSGDNRAQARPELTCYEQIFCESMGRIAIQKILRVIRHRLCIVYLWSLPGCGNVNTSKAAPTLVLPHLAGSAQGKPPLINAGASLTLVGSFWGYHAKISGESGVHTRCWPCRCYGALHS